ncbi:hypothetical protein [Psychrobacillus sp. FSL K6-2843]|jgi:hypothetical protein|uniref:hypothetical protein n=1 Tax=Psychrobacillus sp. FSL K6-2843 TaxID=2921549 RepID=UPI003159F35B
MSKIELTVLFKKIQKDDKKEVLEFHVQGDELDYSDDLVQLAGSIAILEVKGSEAGKLPVEFKSIQRDSKKTTLKFNVRGDSDKKVIKLYPFAGRNVTLFLEASQISIEEFEEQGDGLEYNVDKNGTVGVAEGQMNMEDINEVDQNPEKELPFADEKEEHKDDEGETLFADKEEDNGDDLLD